jgi:hypothetical protein
MAPRNTTRASVYWNGARVAKIRDIQWNVARANLETTGIGEMDDTYAYGKRTTSGSGTLLYDPDDAATVSLMNRVLDDSEIVDALMLKTDETSAQGVVSGNVLISSQGVPVAVGDLVSCQVSFSVSGGTSGGY